jgi:sigma-B regulation protein RsbU (phosphoserine phosphatase)
MGDLQTDDLDTAPAGFIIFSDAGVITAVNSTLLRLLGYSDKASLSGKSIESILSVAGKIFYQTHFFPLLRLHGNAEEIFFRLKTKEGSEVPVICNAVRKIAADGIASNHCLFIPATQRTKYEQELLLARQEAESSLTQNMELVAAKAELEEKAWHLDRRLVELKLINEDLVQFGKIISHDLQEPIRKIAVFADMVAVESKALLGDAIVDQLRKINRECGELRRLGANLERFISLNVHREQAVAVNLKEILESAFTLAAKDDPQTKFVCTSKSFPTIIGFQRQLEMLFYNLFKNSIQFARPDAPARIEVKHVVYQQNVYQETKDRYRYTDVVRIKVSDNGVGLDRKQGGNYFRIEKKKVAGSLRLTFGLAFCKRVVDNHHGEITIQSAAGEGTSVVIVLPVDPGSGMVTG